MRISDAERHHVTEILREAAGEGRLDLDELDQRLEAAYAARTYADLIPITVDLPGSVDASGGRTRGSVTPRPTSSPPAATDEVSDEVSGRGEFQVAVMSGLTRTGVWRVPRRLRVLALMGRAELDLRRATFASPEVVLTINAIMGGAEVIVGPGTRVVMEGIGIMGGFSGPPGVVDEDPAEGDRAAPVVRIAGIAIMGGVSVKRKNLQL